MCHVEAGLRTNNKLSPFPEEINRQITARICDYHFAPTEKFQDEFIERKYFWKFNISHVGNTVIDALIQSVKKINSNPSDLIKDLSSAIGNKEIILVTGHRRENHGLRFEKICEAIKK